MQIFVTFQCNVMLTLHIHLVKSTSRILAMPSHAYVRVNASTYLLQDDISEVVTFLYNFYKQILCFTE